MRGGARGRNILNIREVLHGSAMNSATTGSGGSTTRRATRGAPGLEAEGGGGGEASSLARTFLGVGATSQMIGDVTGDWRAEGGGWELLRKRKDIHRNQVTGIMPRV